MRIAPPLNGLDSISDTIRSLADSGYITDPFVKRFRLVEPGHCVYYIFCCLNVEIVASSILWGF